jgi:hypothetical protein
MIKRPYLRFQQNQHYTYEVFTLQTSLMNEIIIDKKKICWLL